MNEYFGFSITARGRSAFDSKINKYHIDNYIVSIYDSVDKSYFRIPGFLKNTNLNEAFNNCDDNCRKIIEKKLLKQKGGLTFKQFKNCINNIKYLYQKIETPESYPYDKIWGISSSIHKRAVIFELDINTRVIYYLDPKLNIRTNKNDSTKKIYQFNDRWYCECDILESK